MAKILVIDDDSSIAESLELYLTEEGYTVYTAATGTEGLNAYVKHNPDLVILDIRLPDIDGFTVLEDLRDEDENVKVVMITAYHDMDSTIKAMKGGAFDYIHKPINVEELDMAIKKALKTLEMEKKISGLLNEPSRSFKVGDIIGKTKEMKEIFKTIGVVSQSRTTVLIQGESGTGKELIAKVIHNNTSPEEPYIAVNCSAIVETLLESELFGHEKGSFTGAITRKLGKFELARYGTVFLDEISEMSLNLQAKLLRVLQEMDFERVGGKDSIKVNARIITATNKDLKQMVKEGKFRDDLYYRLNIVSIRIPPLRERREDIPVLVDYLLTKINRELHKKVIGVSDEMMDIFMKYRWPGNVRELENLLTRAVVVAKSQVLTRGDFPDLSEDAFAAAESKPVDFTETGSGRPLTLEEVEEQYIRKVIKENNHRTKGELCDILGISRPTFERKLEKFGITIERD
ncbi:MAG TPA: sigma-54 dependent transcriptional regulator [Syntrophales bacterium]|jgi:two-component system response regulator AtoC|nr:sigma-54 dependent transcriptional regulator [Syntrophales bacterium]HON22135.1 sigma-54 dependent transcriptional regulator [Syntrophales bacterium]HOU78264.1 sigma-54 dependent transcriptional regulator [Syntrophales bacterium]HPC31553.1 sigma-54 dependent transcriptional regulator [Syntrophales bacterium]HQG34794.1 sigma-54 dependent transcriptional regulator [Syntrophales bacterium]